MAEKKVKTDVPGVGVTDAFEVPVLESTERWTDVSLEDGTVIRIKPVVLSAVRLENRYDPEGNPLYSLKINQVMVVASTPDHLRKDAASPSKDVH